MFKETLIIGYYSIIVCVILYLMGAFIENSFHLSDWHFMSRAMVSLTSGAGILYIWMLRHIK